MFLKVSTINKYIDTNAKKYKFFLNFFISEKKIINFI